ncbi:MAG: carboxypeptidase regulatory-like domain-containing protein [Gemmatimonadota bacterium]
MLHTVPVGRRSHEAAAGRWSRARRALLLLFLLLALIPASVFTAEGVSAQLVTGAVTEAGTDRPVVGAMVRLVSEGGDSISQYLTGADGRYRLEGAGPGRYLLEVDRIGFSAVREGPITLEADRTLVRNLSVEPAAVRLAGLAVKGHRGRCRIRDAGETQIVWDEARKALDAATWTRRRAGLHFDLVLRVRRWDPHHEAVLDEGRQEVQVSGGNSVRTLPPEDLQEGGYVRDVGGMTYYYGPSAETLLSRSFLETHCFSVVPDPEGEARTVGLHFEPAPGRDTTDIEGTLWLDAETGRLMRVTFRYTGLHRREGREFARGEVRFLELADGRWVVRDWFILAPLLGQVRSLGAGGALLQRIGVVGVQEYGSEIRAVSGPDGVQWREDAPTGELRGVVYDSIRGRALPLADVRVAGRGWRTRADDGGRFVLRGIPPGRYRIGYSHPFLDSLGVGTLWQDAQVEGDRVGELFLAVPPLERILAAECPSPEAGVVVGFVRDAQGAPVAGARVGVAAGVEGGEAPATTTDALGTFRLCGLPAPAEITLRSAYRGARARAVRVRTRPGRAVRVDLTLTSPGAGSRPDPGLERMSRR